MNSKFRIVSLTVGSFLFWIAGSQAADETISAEHLKFFEARIRPVLVRECYQCHSTESGKTKGGFLLDSRDAIRRGGESGVAIHLGEPDKSLLLQALRHDDLEMPPRRKLSNDILADFERWIELGAPDPRVTKWKRVKSMISAEDITKARSSVWAYQRPKKPARPEVKNKAWPRFEIDYHILSKLEAKELTPAEDADNATLLRRLHFDLTGLPPSPKDLRSFLKAAGKSRLDAIRAKVDELLATKSYGERWGRHWLDVARYAESTGKSVNLTYPHAWRYRDYVIDSFNADKPFTRFIQEQIAGDLLETDSDEERQENLIATGFLALGTKSLAERNPRQFRADVADEQIDITTQAFLGTTVSCARCHDHKTEPIPTADYYALAGIFLSTDTYYGTAGVIQNRHASGLIRLPIRDAEPVTRALSEREVQDLEDRIEDLRDRMFEFRRNRGTANQQQVIRTRSQIAVMQARLSELNSRGEPKPLAMGVRDSLIVKDTKLLLRGDVEKPVDRVPRGFLQVLRHGEATKFDVEESGRRELANWLSSKDNPLTARVFVNRIWLHLFGEGIVATPNNWGSSGRGASHPELVDHLAIRFVESGWSIKSIIRYIVLSRTYQLSSRYDAANYTIDPDNRFLWRANQKQLDAEALRDAILSVSGSLDLKRPLGSSVARGGNGRVGRTRNADSSTTDEHRSVYLPVLRGSLPRALALFDFADPSLSSANRQSSNSPLQALYLMNNEFVVRASNSMSRRVAELGDSADERIRSAFLLAYGREASDEEARSCQQFLTRFVEKAGKTYRDPRRARQLAFAAFCQSLIASAEFRTLN
ncbi:MAG: PSD1 and planctomycete cytochrome C domain-containing protein [Planctomycetota bacterium]